jgi:hypothetical protein
MIDIVYKANCVEFIRPEIEGDPKRRFALPFWPDLTAFKT